MRVLTVPLALIALSCSGYVLAQDMGDETAGNGSLRTTAVADGFFRDTRKVRVLYDRDFSSTGDGVTTNTASPITFSRNSAKQYVDGNGVAQNLATNVAYITTDGVVMDPGTQRWALAPLDASSWTAIGTPTTTTNQASGPFATFNGSAEADLVVDDSASVSEGYSAPIDCGVDSNIKQAWWYTTSCYVAAGTSGTTRTSVRVGILTDGTGSADCTTTGLTSTFQRVTCTKLVGGSPSSVVGRVLVGSQASDTGSILISQCQCDHAGAALAPRGSPSSTTFGNVAAPDYLSIPATDTALWPMGDLTEGDYEVVYSLAYDFPGKAVHIEHVFDVGDLATDTQHVLLPILLQAVDDPDGTGGVFTTTVAAGDSYGSNATTCTDAHSGDPNFIVKSSDLGTITAGTMIVQRMRVVPTGIVASVPRARFYLYLDTCASPPNCHATTLVASDTTGTHCALDARGTLGIGHIGVRPGNIRLLAGTVRRVTVTEIL